MRPISIALTVAVFVTLLALILSTSTDRWITSNVGNSGLWRICTQGYGCRSIPMDGNTSDVNELRSIRAFMILSVIAQAAMATIAVVRVLGATKWNLLVPTIIAGVTAVVCAFIALVIYTSEIGKESKGVRMLISYGWSYGIGWAGFALGIVVVVLTGILDREQQPKPVRIF